MKRPNRLPFGDPSMFHILMGEPDESCEVCRAHGLDGHDMPPGVSGMVILEMGPLDEVLRCNCPLCSQLHFEPFNPEDDPDPDPAPENG